MSLERNFIFVYRKGSNYKHVSILLILFIIQSSQVHFDVFLKKGKRTVMIFGTSFKSNSLVTDIQSAGDGRKPANIRDSCLVLYQLGHLLSKTFGHLDQMRPALIF